MMDAGKESTTDACAIVRLARRPGLQLCRALPPRPPGRDSLSLETLSRFSHSKMSSLPLVPPIFAKGKEPLPPGWTEEDRANMMEAKKYQDYMQMGMESCAAKTVIAGGGGECSAMYLTGSKGRRSRCYSLGFAIGAFFSMMSASFAYEDPLARAQLTTTQKASEIFKEMGRNMYSSGKGFAKVGALFAGIECVIESVSLYYSFIGYIFLIASFLFSIEQRTIW